MLKIKPYLVVFFKIILIIGLVATLNLFLMPKYITKNLDGRIIPEMYREEVSPDIVFLGSSTVYSGVVPAALYAGYGETAYVCATPSQTSWNTYCILNEFLDRYNPKLVVVDIGFFFVENDYAEEVSNRKAYDYMRPSKNKFSGLDDAMADSESKWSYIFPGLRYHERYKDLSIDDLKYLYYKPTVTYNGYIMDIRESEELPELLPMEMAADVRLNERNAEYLQKIISCCKEKDIQILLMKTPSYQSKWGVNFEADITAVAMANDIHYVNFDLYSDAMDIDWMHDSPDSGRHLNLYGAEKFSYYLGNIIWDYYDIPDRREDPEISNIWNEKVKRYTDDKEIIISK